MGNSNIKQHIETAEKTGACQLCKLGLKEFPEDIKKLSKNLRTLDLSENKIPSIPPYIGGFSLIKTLSVNNNRIGSLPEEIGNLKKLETLSLENNMLTSLPGSFKNLSHLRTLSLTGNGFRSFPDVLSDLKSLDAVDLSRNKVSEIPGNVRICQVIELNLNQNQISTLPESIAEWPRLKVLRLEENCLEITALTPKIMKESKIALFAVEGNVFDMKMFTHIDGYDQIRKKIMENYQNVKKSGKFEVVVYGKIYSNKEEIQLNVELQKTDFYPPAQFQCLREMRITAETMYIFQKLLYPKEAHQMLIKEHHPFSSKMRVCRIKDSLVR